MGKIIDFMPKDHSKIEMPTKEDIEELNYRANQYDSDDMLDVSDWTGDCFKTLFEGLITDYAKEKNLDRWDVFAVLIHKLFET